MVYESDFYTTRRPYRPSPSVSSYTVSRYLPSRQIRILPGIGRVHVVHSYDRLIPYIGHKRLTIVSAPPHVIRVRPSIYIREIDRIQHKARPYHYYSPTSSYLNSEPITFFDDETRLIRAQAQSLVRKIHAPLPRIRLSWPLYPKTRYHYEQPLTAKIISDDYVHRMLSPIQSVKSDIYRISHYVTDPIRKHLGPSHLACVRYGGDRAYSRRRNLTLREIYAMQSDTVRNDIQLLSYYINANKDRKALYEGTAKASTANLNAQRISRVWSKPQMMLEPSDEIKELREQRAERFRKIQEVEVKPEVETKIKRSTKKEEERLAEERALAEEQAKQQQAAKKEEETRRAELVRQEALAAQAAAERQAEIERKAELARQEELNKKAEAERLASEKAEKARLETEKAQAEKARVEEEKRAAELARQEEERQQLLRLEELARQAEEEKEKELARQAEELAELARQEAELAELARKEAELAELAKQELEQQEQESAELDRQEAEGGEEELDPEEQVVEEAEVAGAESNIPAEATEEAVDEDTAEPVVEEPETPEATESAPVAEAVEVDEEEEEEEEE